MDVFPLLSPHFSPFWCVCCLIPSLQPTPPILTLSCCHSHGAGCNIPNTLVTDCESRNVSSKSFSQASWSSFCLFPNSDTMLFESVMCTLPINPELIQKPKARSEPYRGFVMHSAQIHGYFNGTFLMSFGFFWIQLSYFLWMSSSIGSSVNTLYFNLCCSSKYSGSELNCNSQHSSNWSERHITGIWSNLWCLWWTQQVLVKKPHFVSNIQYLHSPSVMHSREEITSFRVNLWISTFQEPRGCTPFFFSLQSHLLSPITLYASICEDQIIANRNLNQQSNCCVPDVRW